MTHRSVRVLGWIALLSGAIVALRLAAGGDLAPPPLTSLDALEAWVDVRGPIPTAIGLVRLLAEVAAWYLLALSALHVLAGMLRLRGGHALADALALPGTRRLVRAALGMGLVAASAAPGSPTSGPEMVIEAGPGTSTDRHAREVAQDQVSVGTATMRPLEHSEAVGTATMTPIPGPRTWPVQRGESFWTIAADLLEDAWGRPPTDREIDPFWRALVDTNRGRLVDPDDPDLILAGQVFEIPRVPPAG